MYYLYLQNKRSNKQMLMKILLLAWGIGLIWLFYSLLTAPTLDENEREIKK